MTKPIDSNKGHKPRSPKSPVKPNHSVDSTRRTVKPSNMGSSPRTGPQAISLQTANQSNNGQTVVPKDTKILTEAQFKRLLNSPNISSDYKVISQPPFSDVNLVTDNIYLTGMFGITKEKFEKLNIISKSAAAKTKSKPSLIVNATKELPNLIDYDCIRVFVSCP